MDYWKDVPGIDEAGNTEEVRAIRTDLTKLSSALSRMASKDKRFKKAEELVDKARKLLFDLQESAGDAKNYVKRDVLKQMIKSGKWEVDSGDVEGKSGSSLVMRSHIGKKRNVIIEASGMDSQYVQKGLEALIDDFKREPYEKHMVPVLKFILSRLNQSFPDGDVTDADIQDLLSEPGARSALKKSKMSKFDVSDMVLKF